MDEAKPPRRGANALEYALTLPLLIAAVFGIVEYGWYFYRQSIVSGAVHDGCREGSLVSVDTSDPVDVARKAISDALQPFQVQQLDVSLTGSPPMETLVCSAVVLHEELIGLLPTPSRFESQAMLRLEIQR